MRYHIETFRDPHLQRLQSHANQYLAECEELDARVQSVDLKWMAEEYHLVILLLLPDEDKPLDTIRSALYKISQIADNAGWRSVSEEEAFGV